MNMKFMRFSKLKGDGGDGDGTTMEQEAKPVVLNEASNAGPKGFHDNSEWFAPEAGKNESNHKKRVVKLGRLAGGTTAVVQNLGFTTLKMNERIPYIRITLVGSSMEIRPPKLMITKKPLRRTEKLPKRAGRKVMTMMMTMTMTTTNWTRSLRKT